MKRRLSNFSEFNLDLLLESMSINKLFFSPILRKLLKSVSNQSNIASDLLLLEGSENKTGFDQMTFVDLDKEVIGNFTFVMGKKAVEFMSPYYSHYLSDPNKFTIVVSDMIFNNEYVDNSLSNIWKKGNNGRNSIRSGKFVKKIFGSDYNDNEIEEFVNLVKSKFNKNIEFEIVSGDDIAYWYDCKNYQHYNSDFAGGQLGASCMRNMPKDIFGIYTKNPETCKMLIAKEGGRLVGRALIWKLESIRYNDESTRQRFSGWFMDRIYTESDYLAKNFEDYAKKNGWFYKSYGGSYQYGDRRIGMVSMSVKLENKGKYPGYPYLDTFYWYNYHDGRLYNDDRMGQIPGISLSSTSGSHTRSVSRWRNWTTFRNSF